MAADQKRDTRLPDRYDQMSEADRISFFENQDRIDAEASFWRAVRRERYHPMVIAFWETSRHLFVKVESGWWKATSEALREAEQSNPKGRPINHHGQRVTAYDRLRALNKTVGTLFFGELRYYDDLPTTKFVLEDGPRSIPPQEFLKHGLLYRMIDEMVGVRQRGNIPPEYVTGAAIVNLFADQPQLAKKAIHALIDNEIQIVRGDLSEAAQGVFKELMRESLDLR